MPRYLSQQFHTIKSHETAIPPFIYYERVPNSKKRTQEKTNYKKGYEVRIILNNIEETRIIKAILNGKEIHTGKPFEKHSKIVLPIYGYENTMAFLKTIKKANSGAITTA
jgi:hypothetical protein